MIQDVQRLTGYSAVIDLWMESDEYGTIPLRQVSSKFVIAAKAMNLPPCNMTVVVTVDGKRIPREVHLPNGMSENDVQTEVVALNPVSAARA